MLYPELRLGTRHAEQNWLLAVLPSAQANDQRISTRHNKSIELNQIASASVIVLLCCGELTIDAKTIAMRRHDTTIAMQLSLDDTGP